MLKQAYNCMRFGDKIIDQSQIFYQRKNVFGFVNIKPFLPGHVLLSTVKCIRKYSDLSETDAIELWISAKKIGDNLKNYYGVDSIQYTIQDGLDSGQTVEHVHIHIIPMSKKRQIRSSENIDASEKPNRTLEDMSKEAEAYRQNFNFK